MGSMVKRIQKVAFLDTAKNVSNPTWGLVGTGITTLTVNYNPNKTTEQWIIHENATTRLESYQATIDAEQTAYYGDDVYDFVDNLRYDMVTGADAETSILLIDKYVSSNGGYRAQRFACTVSVNSDGGDAGQGAKITYTIDLNGDPVNGIVTFTGDVPTFTPETVSL